MLPLLVSDIYLHMENGFLLKKKVVLNEKRYKKSTIWYMIDEWADEIH